MTCSSGSGVDLGRRSAVRPHASSQTATPRGIVELSGMIIPAVARHYPAGGRITEGAPRVGKHGCPFFLGKRPTHVLAGSALADLPSPLSKNPPAALGKRSALITAYQSAKAPQRESGAPWRGDLAEDEPDRGIRPLIIQIAMLSVRQGVSRGNLNQGSPTYARIPA